MKKIKSVSWHFPPTTNRRGIARRKHDIKHVLIVETELFAEPTVIMSDIHAQTPELVKLLDEYLHLDKFVMLTAGDMAGENIFGTDGDPTPEYEFLNSRCKEFYFVQGNHDLPDYEHHKEQKLKNKLGKNAMIKNGTLVNTSIGKIAGIIGIISNKDHPYKMPKYHFFKHLHKCLSRRPRILMTHDTPSIYAFYEDGNRYVGNEEIFKTVNKYKPKFIFLVIVITQSFIMKLTAYIISTRMPELSYVWPGKYKNTSLNKKQFTDRYIDC